MPVHPKPIEGYVGKSPEFKTTKTGKRIAHFTVAESDGKDKPTIWWNVQAWEWVADQCNNLQKGDKVLMNGRIKTREYEGKTYYDYTASIVGRVDTGKRSTPQASAPPAPSDDDMPDFLKD